MRNQKPLRLALFLLTILAPHTPAFDSEFDPLGESHQLPQLIRVQVEFIEVPHTTLTRLLAEPRTTANDAPLRTALAELATKGEANIVETLVATARSGQRVTSESIKEFIYPTEYEPSGLSKIPDKPEDKSSPAAPSLVDVTVSPTPTAFETRNLGSTLEIEPTLDSTNKIIDLRFTPEIVYHVGNTTWAEWKDERGDASIRMPEFFVASVRTQVAMMVGQPLFVAALTPKGVDGLPDMTRKFMVFVRCDVLTVGR